MYFLWLEKFGVFSRILQLLKNWRISIYVLNLKFWEFSLTSEKLNAWLVRITAILHLSTWTLTHQYEPPVGDTLFFRFWLKGLWYFFGLSKYIWKFNCLLNNLENNYHDNFEKQFFCFHYSGLACNSTHWSINCLNIMC